jgi:hypothetical protein
MFIRESEGRKHSALWQDDVRIQKAPRSDPCGADQKRKGSDLLIPHLPGIKTNENSRKSCGESGKRFDSIPEGLVSAFRWFRRA